MNTNSKNWLMTWGTSIIQKQLPKQEKLQQFLDKYTERAAFQLEEGGKKGKQHYQGAFVLHGQRVSKTKVLDLFKDYFDNVGGLTIQRAHDIESVFSYSTKQETRVEGPFYAGTKEIFNLKISQMKLKDWQQDLFDYINHYGDDKEFIDRKVIWVEDTCGNTGKSAFVKWLVAGQKGILAHKLPVSSVDRLISAVTKIVSKETVDLFLIDLTRSKGKEQSYDDLFSAIEDIKNGHTVDTMYGNYNERVFEPPTVIIFTNLMLTDYQNSLSLDRWLRFVIRKDNEKKLVLEQLQYSNNNGNAIYTPVKQLIKDLLGKAPTLPSGENSTKKENTKEN